jgi:two-component system response regulator FlrC
MTKLLLVEDDSDLRAILTEILTEQGFSVSAASNFETAKRWITQHTWDIVLSDVNLGEGQEGLRLMKQVKSQHPETYVIMMTAYADIRGAVTAMREGALDYIVKPFEPATLLALLEKVRLTDLSPGNTPYIFCSPEMQRVFRLAKKSAEVNATVLLQGESGTGKEVVARYIHEHSVRATQPFVAINCAAIPENMLEAMLFGYEKGAFTGAYQSSPGKFELAQGGTLLLDEISEMSFGLQAKLLRVLQEKEVERIGGKKTIALDVRIIGTTNRDLKQEIKEGRFREDLFYRLSVFPIVLPPLRSRKEDILPLSKRFIEMYAVSYAKQIPVLSETTQAWLLSQEWRGNVRELENTIQRATVLNSGEELEMTPI